jgi:hypothetical protein
MDLYFVVDVEAKLHLDLTGLEFIFQTRQSSVDFQLSHRSLGDASLEIMNPKKAVSEGYSISSAEAVPRICQDLFRSHTVRNGIIDVGVEGLGTFRKSDTSLDQNLSKVMKLSTFLLGKLTSKPDLKLVEVVVGPAVGASA